MHRRVSSLERPPECRLQSTCDLNTQALEMDGRRFQLGLLGFCRRSAGLGEPRPSVSCPPG